MANAKEIIERFTKAQKRKTNWKELYEDALCYLAPHRETFDEADEAPGQDKDGDGFVFDSAGQDALQKFASNIQSSLTPPFRKWAPLEAGPSLQGDRAAEDALEGITDVLFSNLHNSNFDTQIAESFLDLGVGTGAMLVFKGTPEQPFNFVNVPLSQLYLEEGANGLIDVAFRCSKIPVRNIERTWPDAKLGKEIKDKVKDNPDELIEIIEGTIPEDIKVPDPETKELVTVRGYKYYVVAKKAKEVIVERQQRSSPWLVFRWSTIPGEIYGRGPGLFALPDVKTLNKTKELLLKAASISIFGMYTVEDDGEINIENIELGTGAMIPVSSNGGVRAPSIAPLAPPGDPNLAQIIIQDLRNSINNIMFADPLGPIDLPVKTATEVSLRQQELSKRIGSAFGKLQFELITPLINRCLDILDELGLIDLGPFRVDGNNIAIRHTSPLALAQSEEELINDMRLLETATNFYGPQVTMAMMPPDRFLKSVARKLNVSKDILATDEEIETIKQAITAQAAAGGEVPGA